MKASEPRVIFVELRDGRPFTVLTFAGRGEGGYDVWDFQYSRQHDHCYYDLSGGWGQMSGPWTVAPDAQYWLAPNCPLQIEGGVRVAALPRPYTVRTLFSYASESDTVYCPACDDELPVEYGVPCAHLWWCEVHGQWGGTGEGCEHAQPEETADDA